MRWVRYFVWGKALEVLDVPPPWLPRKNPRQHAPIASVATSSDGVMVLPYNTTTAHIESSTETPASAASSEHA